MAATGKPGSPMTGLPPTMPSAVGLPGAMLMPWAISSPSSSIARGVKSSDPAEEPASTTTMSYTAAPSRIAARSRSRSSGTASPMTAAPPASRTMPAATSELNSTTLPSSSSSPGRINSVPVGRTSTHGRGATATSRQTRGQQRPDVGRADPPPGGKHHLARGDLLPGDPDVLPGRRGTVDLDAAVLAPVQLFRRDHDAAPLRDRVAGVDPEGVARDGEPHGGRLARGVGALGRERDAVHRGGVIERRGVVRAERRRGDSPEGLRGGDRLGGAVRHERGDPLEQQPPRLVGPETPQVASAPPAPVTHARRSTSTSSPASSPSRSGATRTMPRPRTIAVTRPDLRKTGTASIPPAAGRRVTW